MCPAGACGSAVGQLAYSDPVLSRRPHGLRCRAANDNHSDMAQACAATLMVAGVMLVGMLALFGVPIPA
ncbi:hypothetical protein [Methylobacterium nigriterrae]|uniref:hypothetical protein n=1 Tax=Methylobacterium nigriterrae TaxID=3127512 RepID=UPI00301378C7